MKGRPSVVVTVAILVVVVILATSVWIIIFVNGTKTTSNPEVVHLSRTYCSAVFIQNDVLLTAEHCLARVGDHIWDGWATHVGQAAVAVAACRNGLAVFRAQVDAGYTVSPVRPDVSDLADGADARLVGYGLWPSTFKSYADGAAHDATCGGCTNPRKWRAKLDEGSSCTGDSGGGGYTRGTSEKLAGIIEELAGEAVAGCGSDVVLHRLDPVAMDWVNNSLATYSGTTIKTCP